MPILTSRALTPGALAVGASTGGVDACSSHRTSIVSSGLPRAATSASMSTRIVASPSRATWPAIRSPSSARRPRPSRGSRPSTSSIRSASCTPSRSTTRARASRPAVAGAKPSSGRTSTNGTMLPRRLATPRRWAGARGTLVYSSSTTTSREKRTSTAKRQPASETMHARAGGARACASAGSVVTAGPPIARSPDELADDGDELLGGEGLAQIFVGALALAPHAIALLVLGAHENHRHRLGASVALEAAQDLVAVAVGHDDVEKEQIRALLRHAFLELLAVGETDDVVPGGFENAFHQLQLGLGVVDHHHFGHPVTVLLVTLS